MKRLLALLLLFASPVDAVPVVPNFQTGRMTSHTETTSRVTETINSMDYQSGWQYTVTGNNITTDANSLVPPVANTTNTIEGVTSTWTSLNAGNMPNFTIRDETQPWQLTTTLSQPGLKTQTIIQRVTDITSVTDTTSTFSQ